MGKEDLRKFAGIDRKARMQLPFREIPIRPASERAKDFDCVWIPWTHEQAIYEASRCIHCADPAPCHKACPAQNDISLALWLIEQGKFIEAAEVYRQTSFMPEICGLVCPHDHLCQSMCVRGKRGGHVNTGALEVFVTSYERQVKGSIHIPVGSPTGKKVAIIGAGPAGMTCAAHLIRHGHAVTIFEARTAPGGLLMYGIPNFKLPKQHVIDCWNDLAMAGVELVSNSYMGKDKKIHSLFSDGFHAIFIGVGVGLDAMMNVPGEDLVGVCEATEFLIRANTPREYLPPVLQNPPKLGRKVIVIGGGDTASDCLRTAVRMGTEEVTCIYRRTEAEMPGNKYDRRMAKEEGAEFQFLTQPLRFVPGDNGRLAKVECIKMELGEPDRSGRPRPVPIEGSNFFLEVDTAIKALGYWPDEIIGKTTANLSTHKFGLIVTDPHTGATSREGIFAGGDVAFGPDLVVTAMASGQKSAGAIHDYLVNCT
jgi:glutamate synthase (NADPH) small chain